MVGVCACRRHVNVGVGVDWLRVARVHISSAGKRRPHPYEFGAAGVGRPPNDWGDEYYWGMTLLHSQSRRAALRRPIWGAGGRVWSWGSVGGSVGCFGCVVSALSCGAVCSCCRLLPDAQGTPAQKKTTQEDIEDAAETAADATDAAGGLIQDDVIPT